MNNNFFALARYLRDLGHEADLYLEREGTIDHFHPRNDTLDDVNELRWIREFPTPYHWKSYWLDSGRKLQNVFARYEKIIACGASVGILFGARIQTDLFVPFGSDLIQLPFGSNRTYRGSTLRKLLTKKIYSRISRWQALGIQKSKAVICNTNWKLASTALCRLGVEAINLPRIMVYLPIGFRSELLKMNPPRADELRVFSPTRHLWATDSYLLDDFAQNGGVKRNDVLIRAFADVVRRNVYRSARLVFCEYGADVPSSKALINDLGVADHVTWLPLLPRVKIFEEMRASTFVADQFRLGMSGTSAGTANEALACGVPVITNSDGACQDPADPYHGSPILDAINPSQVFEHLMLPARDPNRYIALRQQSLDWFNENLTHSLAKRYLDLIQ